MTQSQLPPGGGSAYVPYMQRDFAPMLCINGSSVSAEVQLRGGSQRDSYASAFRSRTYSGGVGGSKAAGAIGLVAGTTGGGRRRSTSGSAAAPVWRVHN